jgi:membrane fusion protein (multidrug efflux system)
MTETTAFSRTFAKLLGDRARFSAGLVVVAVLVLAAWVWWGLRGEITLYEVSTGARVELDAYTSPIESPFAGRVVTATLRVGQMVRQDEILVEIDPLPHELELKQQEVQMRGLEPKAARLRSQISAEQQAGREEQRAARLTAEEVANRIREAESAAVYAEADLQRFDTLHASGLVPERDLQKARADAIRLRAGVQTLQSLAERVPQDQATRDRERDVRIERLRSELAALDAEHQTVKAGIDRVAYEIERRRVRAPIDGVVGESALLRPGAVIREGERLASIVPAGHLIIAASFPADRAFGRIQAAQSATLRLDGFPWAEFGSVSAVVARVGREIRDGQVRVELSLVPGSSFRGTLEHGMPGSVEIAVDRTTPFALALRTAGQALTLRR